jgi:hypothetical protein
MGFEPTISVLERAKTVNALDLTATVIYFTFTSLQLPLGPGSKPSSAVASEICYLVSPIMGPHYFSGYRDGLCARRQSFHSRGEQDIFFTP